MNSDNELPVRIIGHLIQFALGWITKSIAVGKGRKGTGWYVYGALLGPIAIIHALLMSDKRDKVLED